VELTFLFDFINWCIKEKYFFFIISEKKCSLTTCQVYICIPNFYKFFMLCVSVLYCQSSYLFFTTTNSKCPAISNKVFLGDQPCEI